MTKHKTLQARHANTVLMRLLRTPKTRRGLIAAVSDQGMSSKFVEGWLVERCRSGTVTQLKSQNPRAPFFQLSKYLASETPAEGQFPSWLEPRGLPPTIGKTTYVNAVDVTSARYMAQLEMEARNETVD